MNLFDTHIMVDWSGGNDAGPKPKADAIWVCVAGEAPVYLRNRQLAETWLADRIAQDSAAGRRTCIGFDFAFGYPAGFAKALTGADDPLRLWDWLETRIEDSPKSNNRFDLAAQINNGFAGVGPFWGNALARDIDGLPRKGRARTQSEFAEKRAVEHRAKGAFSVWQLAGAGAVGSQVLMGLPVLARLRRDFNVAVWPFEQLDRQTAFVEIWPSLLNDIIRQAIPEGGIKDAHQVEILAQAVAAMDAAGTLQDALDQPANDPRSSEEGWILGVGAEPHLRAAAQPSLRNDCFALPPGVNWTPVDEALARLEAALVRVTKPEDLSIEDAQGRLLTQDMIAARANPPAPNAAVDGYGFAHESVEAGAQCLPLQNGRAAAGAAYQGRVPPGHALRILTGAVLPEGVDTVVLEEDCSVDETSMSFAALPKPGANTRKAGEDVEKGAVALTGGTKLGAPELALAAALGNGHVSVFAPLRVGVLSTGDELIAPGRASTPEQTYDANGPMLLSILRKWGYKAVDLGRAPDDRAAVRARFDDASQRCDAILTSGGASAGDEDHVSALLRDEGQLTNWRIALKPGRPLALAQWNTMPVFGLPGNPVAAFVCTLIFARPALSKLAGGAFDPPQGFDLIAGFEKRKKPGRREYLRARIGADGRVEVFASEGSGRISGLAWADGLVELPDEALHIKPGDRVRYLPFTGFGL